MKRRRMGVAASAAVVMVSSIAGCATFERGTDDQLYVLTDPPGARVTVSSADVVCFTPCSLDVNRKDPFTVAVSKPGYDPQQVEVKTQSTGPETATSPDITPDYLGRVIDYQNGAHLIHIPNPVRFKLNKTAAPAG